jgi:hypothetical protein
MVKMRYWIFDKDETPQRFPLQRLFRRVRGVVGSSAGNCEVMKARGYGLQIHEWEEALDGEEKIVVAFDLLDSLSQGTEEWFYDFEAQLPDTEVRFGLHDSTALFVEAAPSIAEQIASVFVNIRRAS